MLPVIFVYNEPVVMSYQVLLYYHFEKIENPETFAEIHRRYCEFLGLHGRIIVATEGLNGTVSGTTAACEEYQRWLHSDPRFSTMPFKIDEVDGHRFKRIHVRVREEIITLSHPLKHHPSELTGVHLTPTQWREMLAQGGVTLLDGRNGYESDMGRFKGAICPDVESFKEFPDWIENNLSDAKDKPLMTYCTGGIRCEKLSTYLLESGFKEVYQLSGGIVAYGKDPETEGEMFEGACFVFDDRIASEVNHKDDAMVITRCLHCQVATIRAVNCTNIDCNKFYYCCENCDLKYGQGCKAGCESAPRKRPRSTVSEPVA